MLFLRFFGGIDAVFGFGKHLYEQLAFEGDVEAPGGLEEFDALRVLVLFPFQGFFYGQIRLDLLPVDRVYDFCCFQYLFSVVHILNDIHPGHDLEGELEIEVEVQRRERSESGFGPEFQFGRETHAPVGKVVAVAQGVVFPDKAGLGGDLDGPLARGDGSGIPATRAGT